MKITEITAEKKCQAEFHHHVFLLADVMNNDFTTV